MPSGCCDVRKRVDFRARRQLDAATAGKREAGRLQKAAPRRREVRIAVLRPRAGPAPASHARRGSSSSVSGCLTFRLLPRLAATVRSVTAACTCSVMTRHAVDRRVHRLAGHAGLVDVAMAVHAPPHRQRLDLPHALHRFDRPVTLLARHRGGDVRAMIEVHEVGQLVDPLPRDRLRRLAPRSAPASSSSARASYSFRSSGDSIGCAARFCCCGGCLFVLDGGERRGHARVAVHADVHRGNAGVAALVGARVAVQTLDLAGRPRAACASRRSVGPARSPGCRREDASAVTRVTRLTASAAASTIAVIGLLICSKDRHCTSVKVRRGSRRSPVRKRQKDTISMPVSKAGAPRLPPAMGRQTRGKRCRRGAMSWP